MNYKNIAMLLLIGVALFSCNQQNESAQITQPGSQKPTVFAKGEIITNDNFTGTAWLNNLVQADSINQNAVGIVTFEPGARTKWHSHPAGQIILALDGVGYYQEKGSLKIIVNKGDVVKCPADMPHWHGASAGTAFVQIAVTSRQNGPTVWLTPVTDEEYTY
ncbi:cupin domain-containing protein [Agriterribacter sp.]|uniref:cupin domain-containing protein n=1 Tax=Agriterribacter sp. TaxID=2821509 RepID=UPI002CCD5A5D|nr:cupin domain-containing protein [Agriterribacter sp.]HRO45349.1 cupin domain-containing protein [Agriterribacter sp.]HRQ19509.1 cupin domain-containing protein [Agriterribacter sp.]